MFVEAERNRSIGGVALLRCYLITAILLTVPLLMQVPVIKAASEAPLIVAAPAVSQLRVTSGPLQGSLSEGSPDCGLSNTIKVRTVTGVPVPGVTVRMQALPGSSGGPETYKERVALCPAAHTPVMTGTLTSKTDASGQAQFEQLGRGLWLVWMEGDVDGQAIVASASQGLPPYGNNPAGGGHLELLDPFNEHVGSEPGSEEPGVPAEAVQLAVMSSYVLMAAPGGWVSALDLAAPSETPLPLISIPAASLTPIAATVVQTIGPGGEVGLFGTPVVVGTVGAVVAYPGGMGKTDAVGLRGGGGIILVLGAMVAGIGLLLWASSYVRRDRSERKR